MRMRSEMARALLMLGGVLPVVAAAEQAANRQHQLIEKFGAEEFEDAWREAQQTVGPNLDAVEHILRTRRAAKAQSYEARSIYGALAHQRTFYRKLRHFRGHC